MDQIADNSSEINKLIDRMRGGDPEAINLLFAHYRKHLVSMVNGRLDNRLRVRLDASDVVQDALKDAARRLGGYLASEPVPFGLWLRQITVDHLNKAWRYHYKTDQRTVRNEVPMPERSSLELARQLVSNRSTPSQHLSRKEIAERLWQALSLLSEVDQAVLQMRNFENQSYEEIGLVLGLSADAARKQYVRALLRLSKIFHERESSS